MHARAMAEFKAAAKQRAVVAEFDASKQQGSRRASIESDRGRAAAAASNSKPVSPACWHDKLRLMRNVHAGRG